MASGCNKLYTGGTQMKESIESDVLKVLIIIGKSLSLLVCEKNRIKGLELLDELKSFGGEA